MTDFQNLQQPYFIAEIGQNHNSNMQIAKKLIDATFACDWNCAKFQKRTPSLCVPEDQKAKIRQTIFGEMSYLQYRERLELDLEQYKFIDQYCKSKPVDWSASVWDLPSLEFLVTNFPDIPFIKIPSAMITDFELLRQAASTGCQLIVSTGMSEMSNIDDAVNTILTYSKLKPVLLHCNSSYPAPYNELNLSLIPILKKTFDCTIGYSGHESDLEPTVIAMVMGAMVIERHVTISHFLPGTDHSSSLEVVGMDILKKRAASLREMLGDGVKRITAGERTIMEKLRRVK
jgi:N-acetylneuraminate synthase